MSRIEQAHEEADALPAPGTRRRLMAGIALLALAGALAACGPKTYRAALVEQGAISQAVASLQQAEHDAYQGQMYDEARHQRYAQVIDQLGKSVDGLNDAMTHWKNGEPTPPVVADALKGLQRIQSDQATLDTPSSALLARVQQLVGLLTASEG